MSFRISTVLVVDDNPIARATAVHLIQDLGLKVVDAYDGATALVLLKANPKIDLLFLDVRMPGMSGPELAEAARALRPDIKVVFTSGVVEGGDVPSHVSFVRKPSLGSTREGNLWSFRGRSDDAFAIIAVASRRKETLSPRAPSLFEDILMSKKPTGVAAGNSEAIRIYERMEEERQRKAQAKAEANKPKKVTLPRLKFLDQK
jgi:CheY-like chemotaxis protein